MTRFLRFITSSRTSWVVLVVAAAVAAVLFGLGSASDGETAPPVGLPSSAESERVAELLEDFPDAEGTSALLVYAARQGGLDPDAVATITDATRGELAALSLDGFVPPPTVSDDGTTALVVVPLAQELDLEAQAQRAERLRAIAEDGLEAVDVYLTGAEGFDVDVAAVFDGADASLLVTTVLVVAVLLLITYRSPWLWLVPLIVIGVADGLAGIVAARVAGALGITLDASVRGILSVLVFGAGTNYALLLIARYRDELRVVDDRRAAMVRAVRGAGPAVLASGGTVALALMTLLLAELAGTRALGLAGAVGIVVAMVFALVVLPAALVLFGRGLFWPYVPRYGAADAIARSPWGRLGVAISRRPVVVVIAGALVLAALASGLLTVQTGLSQNDRFLQKPDAVVGQEVLAEAFPGGATSPTIVVAPARDAEAVAAAAARIEGIAESRVDESSGGLARISVVLEADPETPAAFAKIERLRADLDDVGAGDALVGGLDARALDLVSAQQRDQSLVIPLILVLVLLVLIVLLRALVAPLLLLVAVVASFFAAVGAAWWLFRSPLFGFPAIDTNVLLLSFLFLVALGVDYSIFLVTRAQEESERLGTTSGMIRALAATGAVITSAGILLAAVFVVLGVLPLITLTQIGVIVCIGVLIDTLLVRTVIVPAFAFLAGDAFWWPRRPRGAS